MSLLVTLIFPVQAFKLLVSQICNHFSLLLFWNMYHPTQSVWLWAVYKIIKQQMQKKTTHTIKNQLKQYMAPRNISAHFDQKGWGNNQVLIAFPKAGRFKVNDTGCPHLHNYPNWAWDFCCRSVQSLSMLPHDLTWFQNRFCNGYKVNHCGYYSG